MKMRSRHYVLLILVLLFAAIVACSLPAATGTSSTPTLGEQLLTPALVPAATTTVAPMVGEQRLTPAPAPAATATVAPTASASTMLTDLLRRVVKQEIVLLTPTQAAGRHPKFEWQPVAEAVRYSVVVRADGKPYWAWEGSETLVYLGGAHKPPPADRICPMLIRPMEWYVTAFDAQGKIIAYSKRRPIAP